MKLLTTAMVLQHLMRGPHHSGIKLLPAEVAVFEQASSAWPVAKLKELDEVHLTGDGNSLNANATTISTSINEFYRHPGRFINLEGWQQHGTCPRPFPMLPIVGVRARHFVIDDRVLHGVLADLGMTTLTRAQAIKAGHAQRDPVTGQVVRQWEWELSKGQLKHDSGLTKAKQDTARWSAAIQPQLLQLAAATPAGTTLGGLHAHILALKATWDALWEDWKDREAPPPIGKEYQQGYKRVNYRLPKGRQRMHRAAEYRRGIDGRARNNA
ncbi:hypothetical protein HaLaN_27432, partial [Haematococcus lacustris]